MVVQQSMAETLRDALGDSSARALLFYLGMGESSIDVGAFHANLPKVLGAQAAIVVEKTMTKELFSRVGLSFREGGSFDFLGSLDQAKEAVVKGANM